MQTGNKMAQGIIRGWVAHELVAGADYKDLAATYSDAIRERALCLQDNIDLGSMYDEDTIAAMAEVRDNMPCGTSCPRGFWAWYNS